MSGGALTLTGDMTGALRYAHRMIKCAVSGKPLEFDDLENYMIYWSCILEHLDERGTLIESVLERNDLTEAANDD